MGFLVGKNNHIEFISFEYKCATDFYLQIFFKGAVNNSNTKELCLRENWFGVDGVKYLLPFLHNSPNLIKLQLYGNKIYREGFDLLIEALQVCPIKDLSLGQCGIVTAFMKWNITHCQT